MNAFMLQKEIVFRTYCLFHILNCTDIASLRKLKFYIVKLF